MRMLLLVAALAVPLLSACQERGEETGADDGSGTVEAQCAKLMERNPDVMCGTMASMMADSAMGSEMMTMMMRHMMSDPQMHREMMQKMGGMEGMRGMDSMPGMQGMEGMRGMEGMHDTTASGRSATP